MEAIQAFFDQYGNLLLENTGWTLYMTFISTAFAYVIGIPLGILLVLTAKDGLKPNVIVYKIVDVIVNIVRSVPFLILLLLMTPMTRALVGKSYGPNATIVPLIASAAPYVARMVEQSLLEVDHGVIEAAQSMGAGTWTIVFKVMIAEAKTSLLVGCTIALATILGYSAMAGAVGGGGLGAIAISYGYNRYQTDVMFATVILLIVLVQIMQVVGMGIAKRTDRRVNG